VLSCKNEWGTTNLKTGLAKSSHSHGPHA